MKLLFPGELSILPSIFICQLKLKNSWLISLHGLSRTKFVSNILLVHRTVRCSRDQVFLEGNHQTYRHYIECVELTWRKFNETPIIFFRIFFILCNFIMKFLPINAHFTYLGAKHNILPILKTEQSSSVDFWLVFKVAKLISIDRRTSKAALKTVWFFCSVEGGFYTMSQHIL